ncbi:MAG: hypothetical protein R2705_16015 [Ilumatobacteraceae bacterium]
MPSGVKIDATPELASVKYSANGLVPAIAQDVQTKAIMMMAWMNHRDAADDGARRGRILEPEPPEVWRKDTSGDRPVRAGGVLRRHGCVLFLVEQEGKAPAAPAKYSCFTAGSAPER